VWCRGHAVVRLLGRVQKNFRRRRVKLKVFCAVRGGCHGWSLREKKSQNQTDRISSARVRNRKKEKSAE